LTLFAGLLIVPTALVGVVLMQIAESTLKTDGRDYRIALAEDIGETVETSLRTGTDGLVGVAQMLSNPDLAEGERIPMAFNVIESNELLDHAHVYDPSGGRIDTIVQGEFEPPAGEEPLAEGLREEAEEGDVAVGPAVAHGEEVRAQMVVPIRAEERVTGYVAAYVPLPVSMKSSQT
jgi:GAF domain-containing protein